MMSRSRSKLLLLGAPLLAMAGVLFFSGGGCGDSGPGGKARPDGGQVCQQGIPSCPAGTVCNNDVCARTCASDGTGCPAGQYCQGTEPARLVCVATTPINCTVDQDCPLPQFCRSSLCVSVELQRDGGSRGCLLTGPDDTCAGEAICLQTVSATGTPLNNCYGMPACGQDGSCPVGNTGSVCNDQPDGGRLFANKQRVCLISYCTSDVNCESMHKCILFAPDNPRGYCSGGRTNEPCFTGADCFNSSGVCAGADGGFADAGTPGLCQ